MSILRVAEIAGVSKSTVSLVINHSPLVADETAAKVREAMESIGYVPRPRHKRTGRKPKESRTLNLALLALGIPRAVLRTPVYADLLHGVEARSREAEHRLTLHHAPEPDALAFDALGESVDGVVLFGGQEPPDTAKKLRRLPCVSVMAVGEEREWTDYVSYDDAAAGRLAAEYLLKRGHRRCACVGQRWSRGRAFCEAIRASGGTVREIGIAGVFRVTDERQDVDPERMAAIADRLCSYSPRPTAVFVWADLITAALYPLLYERGVHPGRDLEIVSCNNEWPFLFGLYPPPAVVDIRAMEVGRAAVDQLINRIGDREAQRTVQLLAPKLVTPDVREG